MKELEVLLISPGFRHKWFRIYPPGAQARDVELLPFALDTGESIVAGYEPESGTVVMTEHPRLCSSLAIGLAANYIEFLLMLSEQCRY